MKMALLTFLLLNWIAASVNGSSENLAYYNLEQEDIKNIHKEVIQKHLNFLEKYPRGGLFNNLSEWWLCNRMRFQWKEFEQLFPGEFDNVELPDSIDRVIYDYKISIFLPLNAHFSPYEDTLIELRDGAVITGGPDGPINHYYERIFNPQKIWHTEENDSTAYYLYAFREEMFGIRGNILISDERPKEIKFLSGPVLPLNNHSSWIIDQLISPRTKYQGDIKERWEKKQQDSIINKKVDTEIFHGIYTYIRVLILSISPERLLNSSLLNQKSDSYIFNIKPRFRYGDRYDTCKAKPSHSFPLSFLHYVKRNTIYSSLCNNYDGRIVTELYIKINPETGDVAFKIGDRTSIRRMPECKNLKE